MSDFLYPVPKSVCLHMLRSESRSRGYSDSGVRISVLLHVDAGSVRSQLEYTKLWGWTRKKVRHHWKAIWEDVADWCCSYGRQMNSPLVEKLPEEWQKHIAEKYADEQKEQGPTRGHSRGQLRASNSAKRARKRNIGAIVGANEGPTRGQPHYKERARHPIPTSLQPEEKENPQNPSGSTPLGVKAERKEPRPKFRPPSIEEALEYFAELGRPDLANAFFDHFTSNGWKVSGRAAMKDWKAAARNWIRNDKKFNGNGKRQNGHSGSGKKLTPATLSLYDEVRRRAS